VAVEARDLLVRRAPEAAPAGRVVLQEQPARVGRDRVERAGRAAEQEAMPARVGRPEQRAALVARAGETVGRLRAAMSP
jgi:hypothetical protein